MTETTPEPTPEQIELIMIRLIGASGSAAGQAAIFRIGKRAGLLWDHRGCSSPRSVNFPTAKICIHCGAPRPAVKETQR